MIDTVVPPPRMSTMSWGLTLIDGFQYQPVGRCLRSPVSASSSKGFVDSSENTSISAAVSGTSVAAAHRCPGRIHGFVGSKTLISGVGSTSDSGWAKMY